MSHKGASRRSGLSLSDDGRASAFTSVQSRSRDAMQFMAFSERGTGYDGSSDEDSLPPLSSQSPQRARGQSPRLSRAAAAPGDDVVVDLNDPMQMAFAARGILAQSGQLQGRALLHKWSAQYATYPINTLLSNIQAFIYHKEKGVPETIRSALQFTVVVGAAVTGGCFKIIWPTFTESLKSIALSSVGFLGEGFADFASVLASVLITASVGAKLSDSLLLSFFNKILRSAHPTLFLTENDITSILAKNGKDPNNEALREKVRLMFELLNGEYLKLSQKYQDFHPRGDHFRVLRVGEKTRSGDLKAFEKFCARINAGDRQSLSRQPKPDDQAEEALTQINYRLATSIAAPGNG